MVTGKHDLSFSNLAPSWEKHLRALVRSSPSLAESSSWNANGRRQAITLGSLQAFDTSGS
jgi:hypothetical protein